MTHQIELPTSLEEKLRDRAAAAGTDAETFIIETLAKTLQGPKSYRDIFAPLHQAFGEKPISENELATLVEQARDERYRRGPDRNHGAV